MGKAALRRCRFNGASRYIHPAYAEGFALECSTMKRAIDDMGLTNIKLMTTRHILEVERKLKTR